MLRADQVLTDPVEMLAYECDAYTIHKGRPDVVVHPESTEQCAAVVKVLQGISDSGKAGKEIAIK